MDHAYLEEFMNVFEITDEMIAKTATAENTKNWDSYNHLELVAVLEKRFCVRFTGEEITKLKSYESGRNILKEKGVQFQA